MPDYRFPLANGKTLILSGDQPPSPQEIRAAAQAQKVELAGTAETGFMSRPPAAGVRFLAGARGEGERPATPTGQFMMGMAQQAAGPFGYFLPGSLAAGRKLASGNVAGAAGEATRELGTAAMPAVPNGPQAALGAGIGYLEGGPKGALIGAAAPYGIGKLGKAIKGIRGMSPAIDRLATAAESVLGKTAPEGAEATVARTATAAPKSTTSPVDVSQPMNIPARASEQGMRSAANVARLPNVPAGAERAIATSPEGAMSKADFQKLRASVLGDLKTKSEKTIANKLLDEIDLTGQLGGPSNAQARVMERYGRTQPFSSERGAASPETIGATAAMGAAGAYAAKKIYDMIKARLAEANKTANPFQVYSDKLKDGQ